MDNFMDKLVDRINLQGAVRSQSMGDPHHRGPGADDPAIEERLTKKLASFEEKLATTFTDNVTAAVNESNAKYAEMIEQYKKENEESRLSATEELMAAQASSREGMIEALSGNVDTVKTELSEYVHKENVKCYKNIQAAVEESNGKLVSGIADTIDGKNKTIRNLLIAAIVLLAANLGCIITVILWMFRVI